MARSDPINWNVKFSCHNHMVPYLNDALDFSQKLFTRAILAILEGENSKYFLGTSTPTMVGLLRH